MRPNRHRRHFCIHLGVAAVVLLWHAAGWAHGVPPDLAFYGDFSAPAARCQRLIGAATETCIATAIQTRSACQEAPLAAETCDQAAADAAVDAAHQQMRNRITAACTAQDTSILQFGAVEDAQRDAAGVCQQLETAAVSASFGPLLAAGSVATIGADSRSCVQATATAIAGLLRSAAHLRRRALDRIAPRPWPPSAKLAMIALAQRRLDHIRAGLVQQIEAACPASTFQALYGRDAATLLAAVAPRGDCFAGAVYVQAEVTCPASICGNGIQEPGESCDDGNLIDSDGCSNACQPNSCPHFDTTFALLQQAIFERHGCTNQLCHGATQQGGLDLRTDQAYAQLVGPLSQADPNVRRVVPGDERLSLLYLKLAAKTLGVPKLSDLPGSPMPVGDDQLSEAELEAVRLWIRGGAAADTVVDGTGVLLNACLPPPQPLKIPQPDPPSADVGVQFAMPGHPLPALSENELCVASYYDASSTVPDAFLVDCPGVFPGTNDHGNNAGKCLAYDSQQLVNDGEMHHLVEYIYSGKYDYTDPGWGPWTCTGGAQPGQPCDPAVTDSCQGGVCGGKPSPGRQCSSPFFGAADFSIGIDAPFIAFSVEPREATHFPPGVYALLPLKGIVIWNLHALNRTSMDTLVQAWATHTFAQSRQYAANFLFDVTYIYTMDVAPFAAQEYCATHTFSEGTQLFSVRSHNHKRGKRFRMWRPPQTPCGNGGRGPSGSLLTDPNCSPGAPEDLFYESLLYNEPVSYIPDPPIVLQGSVEQRTIKYCSLYDNGATDPTEVKRASTSPVPANPNDPGGPCPPSTRKCLGGPNVGQLCGGDDVNCPQSVCDACNLKGGVTTDDEMFGIQAYAYFPESP